MDNGCLFQCRFCTEVSQTLSSHLKHQLHHRHVSKGFYCGLQNCSLMFQLESSLRSHIIRRHNIHISSLPSKQCTTLESNDNCLYVCPVEYCKKEFASQRVLFSHIKNHIKSGIITPCPFKDCTATFSTVNSFTGHLSRDHRNKSSIQSVPHSLDNPANAEENQIKETNANLITDKAYENDLYMDMCTHMDIDSSLLGLAQYYLKLECRYFVPESTIQLVADELKILLGDSQEVLLKNIKNALDEAGVSAVTINDVISSSMDKSNLSRNCNELRSSFKRKQFYKSHFNYVEPKKLPIDDKNFFRYVPILETLKATIESKSFNCKWLTTPQNTDEGCLKDFTDGEVFKKNPFFAQNPKSIKVILYQDGVELVSPIGAARNKNHKLQAVYMAIGNLPPEERFRKDAIQLVALCKEKKFCHRKVYGKIVSDLKKLRNDGINIQRVGNIKGNLAFISGDNLGSHALGGFLENFSTSNFFCRYCLANRSSFNENRGECRSFLKRSVQSYKNSIQRITTSPVNKNNESHNGIKFNSAFNELEDFHVCAPGLPPCLGHDLQEGIIAHDVVLFLKYFISNNWFNLHQLNSSIESFPYSEEDLRDKPVAVPDPSKNKKLVGGAWQVWTFLRLFPLIMKNYIKDVHDPVWKCLLLLSQITEQVVAPEVHVSQLPHMQVQIYEYLISRKELFPSNPLRPKHHYLSEYPYLTTQFGPLIKVWTLRFESKHTFFKQAWKAIHNSKNVTHSLSQKHELLQALLRSGADIRLTIQCGPRKPFLPALYSQAVMLSLSSSNCTSYGLDECNWVVLKGIKYSPGAYVVLNICNFDTELHVGCICLILIDSDLNVNFVVRKEVAKLKPHLLSYQVDTSSNLFECLSVEKFSSFYPLHLYIRDAKPYLRLKHSFIASKSVL